MPKPQKKPVKPKVKSCPECYGTGLLAGGSIGEGAKICKACNGVGEYVPVLGHGVEQ